VAGLGQQEAYPESRGRERRLEQYEHWEELLVRLQHRWPIDRVIRWHEHTYPGASCPAKTTLFRYVKAKQPSWFVSRLVLAAAGTQPVHRQLVAQRQAELIETLIMRLNRGLQIEEGLQGFLVPEVTRNFELLHRMLTDHFRVLQEMGLERKLGSMAPGGGQPGEGGAGLERMARLVERIVELPKEEFLPLLHQMFHEKRAKAPFPGGPVIEGQARPVEPGGA
jgi:hypothetical protein